MGMFTELLDEYNSKRKAPINLPEEGNWLAQQLVAPRKYIDNLAFAKGDTAIKHTDYSPEALALLREIIKNEGVGTHDLKRNTKLIDKYAPEGYEGVYDHIFTPYGQLRNTLGEFTVKKDPSSSDLYVTDTYDWSKEHDARGLFDDGLDINTLAKIGRSAQNARERRGYKKPQPFLFPAGMSVGKGGEIFEVKGKDYNLY